jgi:hypothetical protein
MHYTYLQDRSYNESAMTRYKGRASTKSIARDFPYVVEIRVPEGGLGKRLDAMYEFHTRRGINAQSGPGRREGERDEMLRTQRPLPPNSPEIQSRRMSAPPPKADMCGAARNVRYGPIADVASFTRSLRRRRGHRG